MTGHKSTGHWWGTWLCIVLRGHNVIRLEGVWIDVALHRWSPVRGRPRRGNRGLRVRVVIAPPEGLDVRLLLQVAFGRGGRRGRVGGDEDAWLKGRGGVGGVLVGQGGLTGRGSVPCCKSPLIVIVICKA